MAGAILACCDMTELVTDFVEGRMSLWDRLRFQLHLGMCRHCREYIRQMRRTLELTGALSHQPPSQDVEDGLLRRFRDWKSA